MLKRLSDLPTGAKIKETNTKYGGRTLIWLIADKDHQGYPSNSVTLISEKVLLDKKFDGYTTTYKNSGLRGWINDSNGLLKDFSSDFKNAIVDTNVNTASGNVTDKMFLASRAEVGLGGDSAKEGYKFPIFTDGNSRIGKDFDNKTVIWWLRTANSSSLVRGVLSGGSSHGRSPYDDYGVRPLCNLKSEILVSENKDSDGAHTIEWNQPPIIESTTSTNMGTKSSGFSFTYTVTEKDAGQTLSVEEYVDNKKTKDFNATSGSTYTFTLSRIAYQKLLNGNHNVKIVAIDIYGGVTEKVFNFSKNETKILFTLEEPLVADAMVTKAMINVLGSIPSGAILKVEACNNGNDSNPTWEDCTEKVLKERKIFLLN
ncbi:MAG: DUF6273 domain-containing protein, partial [Anaerococcus sp.]